MNWKRFKNLAGALAIAIVFLSAASVRAQDSPSKDDLFSGVDQFAKNSIRSTEVNLGKNMIALAKGSSNLSKLGTGLDSVYVRTFDYPKPGDYSMDEVQKYLKRLDGRGWIHIVRERSATKNTDICMKGNDDGQVRQMVIVDAEPTKLSFIHLEGDVSINQLAKAGASYVSPALKQRPK